MTGAQVHTADEPQFPSHRDKYAADAAALVERFGAAGVGWLDHFLEDYVFIGEPLERVLAKARELSGLPPRPILAGTDDD